MIRTSDYSSRPVTGHAVPIALVAIFVVFLVVFLVALIAAGAARAERAAPTSLAARIDAALSADPPADSEHPAAVVELQMPSGEDLLPGHIYLAAGAGPHPTVVFLHGFPGNEKNLDVAQALRRMGFNSLFFHYRGAWGAGGEYRVARLADDALAVLDYLREPRNSAALRVDARALSVLGHSLGGYAALAAGSRDAGLACVMALSPANPGLWKAGLAASDAAAAAGLRAYADSLFMLRGLSGQSLVDELDALPEAVLNTEEFAAGLAGKRVLMLVGEQDEVTPAATMFHPVAEAYRRVGDLDLTASVISGDHSFSWSRIALTREILSWADGRCR